MSEWDQRQVCPDGGCVGVIGSDGTCKVCGRAAPNWGEERKRGLVEEVDEEDVPEDAGPVSITPPADASPGEWTERKLCPDGGCVGVIGDNGTCKVCGRSAA